MHSSRMHTAHSSSHLLVGGLPQCMLGYPPPGVGLETPLGVGLETPWVWAWRPPRPDPSTSPWVWAWRPPPGVGLRPPGCGPGDPPGMGLETPRPDPSTAPLGVGLEIPPSSPVDITFANFVCGR